MTFFSRKLMLHALTIDQHIRQRNNITAGEHIHVFPIQAHQSSGVTKPEVSVFIFYRNAVDEYQAGNTIGKIERYDLGFLVETVHTLIGRHPQPAFRIFHHSHQRLSVQQRSGSEPAKMTHGKVGYKQFSFIWQEIELMVGSFINHTDFFFMHKSFREHIVLQAFGRRVPDADTAFRTNPSFMG